MHLFTMVKIFYYFICYCISLYFYLLIFLDIFCFSLGYIKIHILEELIRILHSWKLEHISPSPMALLFYNDIIYHANYFMWSHGLWLVTYYHYLTKLPWDGEGSPVNSCTHSCWHCDVCCSLFHSTLSSLKAYTDAVFWPPVTLTVWVPQSTYLMNS